MPGHQRLEIDVREIGDYVKPASIDCIITDPPWSYTRRIAGAKAKKASDYPLLTDRELKELFDSFYRLCKDGAHLYVFCPPIPLPRAFSIITPPWDYIGQIIWDKKRMGLGHYWRNQVENILFFCREPRTRLRRRDLTNLQAFANPGKSRKPPELYRLLAEASALPGATILDPFAGTDPLGDAGLQAYNTISCDIKFRR